jgi:hypothetical protein
MRGTAATRPGFRLFGWQRASEVAAQDDIASELPQEVEPVGSLHAFGDRADAEVVP